MTNAKILLSILSVLLLSGCGMLQREWTSWTGEATIKCFRGITFVQSDSGLAVLPDQNGKPVPCQEEK